MYILIYSRLELLNISRLGGRLQRSLSYASPYASISVSLFSRFKYLSCLKFGTLLARRRISASVITILLFRASIFYIFAKLIFEHCSSKSVMLLAFRISVTILGMVCNGGICSMKLFLRSSSYSLGRYRLIERM